MEEVNEWKEIQICCPICGNNLKGITEFINHCRDEIDKVAWEMLEDPFYNHRKGDK